MSPLPKKISRKKKRKLTNPLLQKLSSQITTSSKDGMSEAIKNGIMEIKEAFDWVNILDIDEDAILDTIDEYIHEFLREETAYAYFDFDRDGNFCIELHIGDSDEQQYVHHFYPDNFDPLGDPYAETGGPKRKAQLDNVKRRIVALDDFISELTAKSDELKATVKAAKVN